ncbi:hypothetical protein GGX14DRAFT_452023 [Mycena pura]|uniref:Uncharacterized protein n=1 Tax=Mycena pura TaxID=153505 RepID=A0AAD6VD31_9AGAR|nr:hypothetical protein GGX14DRAFT_452023 [Mycena pura]
MEVTPADLYLPAFLDPLLAYLSNSLPAPVYSFLITFLSHLLALGTAFYSLFVSILSTHPLQWDAQTVLPPLIALLTSYLAIVSLYRTTSWMFRTSLFFIKWGSILGGLVAAVSWLLAQQDGNALAGRGLTAAVGSLVLNMLNGEGRNAAGGSRSRSPASKSKTRTRKPAAWEPWDRHREWQEREDRHANTAGVQDVFGELMNTANKVITWWDAGAPAQSESEQQKGSKAKSRTR